MMRIACVMFALSCFGPSVSLAEDAVAERILRDRCLKSGMTLGYDTESGSFLAVGGATTSVGTNEVDGLLELRRDELHRIAELKAKAAILQLIRQNVTAGTVVVKQMEDETLNGTSASVLELFAKGRCCGWVPIMSEERLCGKTYSVAVAVQWNEKQNRAKPAENFVDEMRRWLSSRDVGSLAPTLVFVDSNGYSHLIGVGRDGLSSEMGLETDVSVNMARSLAVRNLMLGLYGDGVVRECAISLLKSGSQADAGRSLEYGIGRLACLEVKNVLPVGCMPVCVRKFTSSLTGKKMVAVVCAQAVVPQARRLRKLTTDVADDCVKVFNPITGLFERVGGSDVEK